MAKKENSRLSVPYIKDSISISDYCRLNNVLVSSVVDSIASGQIAAVAHSDVVNDKRLLSPTEFTKISSDEIQKYNQFLGNFDAIYSMKDLDSSITDRFKSQKMKNIKYEIAKVFIIEDWLSKEELNLIKKSKFAKKFKSTIELGVEPFCLSFKRNLYKENGVANLDVIYIDKNSTDALRLPKKIFYLDTCTITVGLKAFDLTDCKPLFEFIFDVCNYIRSKNKDTCTKQELKKFLVGSYSDSSIKKMFQKHPEGLMLYGLLFKELKKGTYQILNLHI